MIYVNIRQSKITGINVFVWDLHWWPNNKFDHFPRQAQLNRSHRIDAMSLVGHFPSL